MLIAIVSVALAGLVLATFLGFNTNSCLESLPAAHFTVPFSRLWILSIRWRSIENGTRIKVHNELGPIVRIGPREVSINCIDDGVRLIFSGKFNRDERLYRAFVDDVDFLATKIGNDEHKKRKRMLSHVYSKSHVLNSPNLNGILDQVIGRLKEELSDWASSGTSIDIFAACKACMVDITTGWLYGTENMTDTLRDEATRNVLRAVFEPNDGGFFCKTELAWLLKIQSQLGINKESKAARDAENQLRQWFVETHANAQRSFGAEPVRTAHCVYDHFYSNLTHDEPGLSQSVIDSIMIAEFNDHLVAGYRATSIGITYAIYELSRNPRALRMLRQELRALADPKSRSTPQRIDELQVLDAVVNETLRLYSPNPGPWPRVVTEPGCRLNGSYDVPPRTVVSASSWSLHRNPQVFPRPEEWRPDRWLAADEHMQHEMQRWMWAFGSGARVCIGRHFALRCFKEILAAIYTEYETLPVEDTTLGMRQNDALMAGPVANCLNVHVQRC